MSHEVEREALGRYLDDHALKRTKQREAILAKVPAARLGTPEDIAAAAVYLSSNEAAYVTGQTIHVNGGMAMI